MTESFDPYHKWLGIAPDEQPADHYRLLGLKQFESDPDVIENAADQRMSHIRTFQSGNHSADSQRILNEITSAKLCLLDPQRKAAYDAEVQAQHAVNVAVPQAVTAVPVAQGIVQAVPEPQPASPTIHVRSPAKKRKSQPAWLIPALAGGVLVLVGIPAAFLLLGGGGNDPPTGNGSVASSSQTQPTTPPRSPTSIPASVPDDDEEPEVTIDEVIPAEPIPSVQPTPIDPDTSIVTVNEPPTSSPEVVAQPVTADMDTLVRLEQAATTESELTEFVQDSIAAARQFASDNQADFAQRAFELAMRAARRSERSELTRQVTLEVLDWQSGDTSGTPTVEDTPSVASAQFIRIDELNSSAIDGYPWISDDGLRLYWTKEGVVGKPPETWMASRPSQESRFSGTTKVIDGRHAVLTRDELTIIFLGDGGLLHVAKRPSTDVAFGPASEIAEFKSQTGIKSPWLSAHGRMLVFQRIRQVADPPSGSTEFVESYARGDSWSVPRPLRLPYKPNNLAISWPSMSADGKTIWFCDGGGKLPVVVRGSRPSERAPYSSFEAVLVDGREVVGRSPRYCPATAELFFCAVDNEQSNNWDLWVVKGYQP